MLFHNHQIDINRSFGVTDPVNCENIWELVRFVNAGPLILKVAPDNFVHLQMHNIVTC